MVEPRITGLATAVPPHVVSQAEAADFARSFFAESIPEVDRLLSAFENSGIERRHLARAPKWYRQVRSFGEKNEAYREAALRVGTEAAEGALRASNIHHGDLGAVVFVSSTGLSTPSLDVPLIQRLGLSPHVARLPLWGLGCAGGAAGLAHAAALVRGTRRPVLLVAVEICSVTFVHSDRTRTNLIATVLFGDGAAAAVVAPEGEGPALLHSHSHLVDDSQEVMGWSVETQGLQVVFSRGIPELVQRMAPEVVRDAASGVGLATEDLGHFALHPGGAKVLDAFSDALGVGPEPLVPARQVLREYGNMSSPTVLFVLKRVMELTPSNGEAGILLALGPGFSAESVLFRW